MKSKLFDLSDIISITTGFLVSNRGMGGVYDILGFMTDEQLFTHQLVRAQRQCEPFILLKYPKLAEIDCEYFGNRMKETADNKQERDDFIAEWLQQQYGRYGKTLLIEKIPAGENGKKCPVQEAEEMFGKNKVITISKENSDVEIS